MDQTPASQEPAAPSVGSPSTGPVTDAVWASPVEYVSAELDGDIGRGLTEAEARQRLARYGPNQIREAPPRGALAILLAQFLDWMIGLLLAAALVSGLIGEWRDSLLILAIVIANAVIGFVQERRAEDAVAALKQLSRPNVNVLRDGTWREGPADQLVPGDVVELGPGSIVPADARVFESVELQTSEAPLTGESLSVSKQSEPVAADAAVADRTSMVFAGTSVVSGRGRVLVTSTGMHTELGKIAALLETAKPAPTPLQSRLADLSRRLALAVVLICAVVFFAGVFRKRADTIDQTLINQMFLTAVSLAVAAVPEGLPAVITVALALGSQRMARRHAIIRQLAAVETLGSVDVICSDKTGTLTENQMTVDQVLLATSGDDQKLLFVAAAATCNNAHITPQGNVVGSATEAALAPRCPAARHRPR
ncbi:MAG: HAD-IC family P-type ATPase [Pirellulales bacterium]